MGNNFGNGNAVETILIIEDDPSILLGLKKNLQFEGYNVMHASDGEEGLELVFQSQPDLVILDIMLPNISGFEICKAIRKKNLKVPIIMLTAKDKEIDKIMGLDLGADDYLTKPFSVRELIARINAVLRRKRQFEPSVSGFTFHNVEVDFVGQSVKQNGDPVEMSPKEFLLLKFLIENSSKVLSRDEILNNVWGYDYFGTSRTVDNFINKLRQKLENDMNSPEYIITVRGVGYKFLPKGKSPA